MHVSFEDLIRCRRLGSLSREHVNAKANLPSSMLINVSNVMWLYFRCFLLSIVVIASAVGAVSP